MYWLLFLVLLCAAPFVREALRPAITQAEREAAPGEFAVLSQGITHYQWLGPARGPVVVAIHGLSTPSPVWYPLAEGLGRLGYRVLVYDLYGRGWSDPVGGRDDSAILLRQLDDLLADQGLGGDLTLMGFSLGGAVATAYAAAHPERMKRLILIAPAGIEVTLAWLDRVIRDVPLLGDWLHHVVAGPRLRRDLGPDDPLTPLIAAQTRRKGFLPALLAARRGLLNTRQEAAHRQIGHDGIPVVALWGTQDAVVPLRALGVLAQWNRAARQEEVAGAGHALLRTHAAELADVLRDVLREV